VTRPRGAHRYEPSAVERIVQIVHGRPHLLHPHLLQKLCLNSLNRMLDDGRTTVRLADVENALEPGGWTRPPYPSEDSVGGEAAP
jgi:hypothetical protein